MADDLVRTDDGVLRLPGREIPPPAGVSAAARQVLAAPRPGRAAYPAGVEDAEAWRRSIAAADGQRAAQNGPLEPRLKADAAAHPLGGVPAFLATPRGERLIDTRHVLLDFHGGGLIQSGGADAVRFNAKAMALRTGRAAYSVDYRMPPDHPYPAALDDAVAAYRALLAIRRSEEIVVSGVSAGGNLAAALLLRARDEGLPAPAGALLLTPEVDLTESGDTFATLAGLDILVPLIQVNRLYAAGADLGDPYLSPLFGDVAGFPPTFLQSGTRDLFLSNTVRLHRKLRAAGVRAELHVWEAMTHGGFGGFTPEDREVNAEMQAFLTSL